MVSMTSSAPAVSVAKICISWVLCAYSKCLPTGSLLNIGKAALLALLHGDPLNFLDRANCGIQCWAIEQSIGAWPTFVCCRNGDSHKSVTRLASPSAKHCRTQKWSILLAASPCTYVGPSWADHEFKTTKANCLSSCKNLDWSEWTVPVHGFPLPLKVGGAYQSS